MTNEERKSKLDFRFFNQYFRTNGQWPKGKYIYLYEFNSLTIYVVSVSLRAG